MQRGTMAQFELIDDFEMYKETKLEDVPQLPQRETMKCKSVADMATEITGIKITTRIKGYDVKKGSMLAKDIVVWQVQSESEDERWKQAAHRTDEDFYDLRKLLVAATPFIMVPPLPPR